ncbi:MAG: hypothetical protein A2W99_01810 [Bacteroidetes bacterium GWF2_33_16]|nr:MAG: hypothetical protein A2X00_16345 [Bacteroidetes bacterium GWE2_32_14]OFY07005.1 MAG: hypothetical protein A2W99_01810 [Bacteroidetes bacterium GWF2_33_16]
MKVNSLIIILTFLLISSFNLFSQETVNKESPINIVSLEASTLVYSYSIKYDFVFNSSTKSKPFLGIGVQYYPYTISYENVYTLFPHLGLLYGNKHFFEASFGASLDFKNKEHLFPVYLGYQYQSQQNFLVLKAGLNWIYLGSDQGESFFDLPAFLPLPTFAIGFRW